MRTWSVCHRVRDLGVDGALDLRHRHQRGRRGRRRLLHDQPHARHGVRRRHRDPLLLRQSGNFAVLWTVRPITVQITAIFLR